VQLTVQEMWDDEVRRAVETGEAELGIVHNRAADLTEPWDVSRWLVLTLLYELDIVLIAPKGHPLSQRRRLQPKDLLRYPLLNTVRSLRNATVIAVLEQLGLAELPPPVVDAFFTASMRRYVGLGFGIALIAVPPARARAPGLHERDMTRYFGCATVYQVR